MSSPSADPNRRGTVRRTSAATLAAFGCIALVAGWGVHYLSRLNSGLDPKLGWPTTAVIYFVAAFVGLAAWRTRQARRARARLMVHRAVNLLALGKASDRAGAVVLGGYAGFALGFLRPELSVPATQLLVVALTCLGGALLIAAGLALEKSCEIPDDLTGAES